jgi:hypothetical protein
MARLTAAQLYDLARTAGFPADAAITMTAIALAESGGDPAAHNTRAPDDSYGLWQINMAGALGPARVTQFGLSSAGDLFDPLTNAMAAYTIWSSGGFRPWGAYTNGSFGQYVASAQQASANSTFGATGGGGDVATGFHKAPAARSQSATPAPSISTLSLPPGVLSIPLLKLLSGSLRARSSSAPLPIDMDLKQALEGLVYLYGSHQVFDRFAGLQKENTLRTQPFGLDDVLRGLAGSYGVPNVTKAMAQGNIRA